MLSWEAVALAADAAGRASLVELWTAASENTPWSGNALVNVNCGRVPFSKEQDPDK